MKSRTFEHTYILYFHTADTLKCTFSFTLTIDQANRYNIQRT